jgi:HSP20 family molecular chaperone IbpA
MPRRKKEEKSMTAPEAQTVPVRVYQGDGGIVVAVPLPGLEAGRSVVAAAGDTATTRGAPGRGARQDERDVLASEWRVGPSYRAFRRAGPVDGARTSATSGNGVLVLGAQVLAMPQLGAAAPRLHTEIRLEALAVTRGQPVGHTGRDMRAASAWAHRQQMQAAANHAKGALR